MVRHPLIPSIDELIRGARVGGERTAIEDRHRRVTYAELDAATARWGSWLETQGIGPGQRVGVCLPNGVDAALSLLGVVRAGRVWAGISTAATAAQRAAMCAMAGVDVVIDTDVDVDRDIGSADPVPTAVGQRRDAHELAAISFTSGTSGTPKGVMHSEYNLMLAAVAGAARGEAAGVTGMYLAMTSVNMQVLGPLQSVAAGGRLVCIDTRHAATVAEAVAGTSITNLPMAAPTAYDWVADDSITRDMLASLAYPVIGGSGAGETLLDEFAARFDRRLTVGYGLTEAPTSVCREPWDQPHRAGSCGVAVDQLEVVVVDAEHRPVPVGEAGEIVVRPARHGLWAGMYRPMLGYVGETDPTDPTDPTAARAARDAGAARDARNARATSTPATELRTGDRGTLDADGFLTVLGRSDALIVRGGANVSPERIEAALRAVRGVIDAAVVPVDDARLGQAVVAIVAGQVAHSAILAAAGQLDRDHRLDGVVVVDRIPRSAAGKLSRSDGQRLAASATRRGDDFR